MDHLKDQRRIVPAAIAAVKNWTPFQVSSKGQIRYYIHVSDFESFSYTQLDYIQYL
jgi:hypothetical protein